MIIRSSQFTYIESYTHFVELKKILKHIKKTTQPYFITKYDL